LLRTAKEPPEHRRIAEYYRQQAERLTNSAKEHQELATIYEKTPPLLAMESKHGTSFGQGGLCRRWAQLEVEQATIAEALASFTKRWQKQGSRNNFIENHSSDPHQANQPDDGLSPFWCPISARKQGLGIGLLRRAVFEM
jgi:hypothetical protein